MAFTPEGVCIPVAGQQPGGWIATLIYASCCMLRLARFNIGNRVEKADGEEKSSTFTGVPAPAGAMLALLPMYVAFIWPEARLHPVFLVLWLLLVGGLMISRIPTPSFKSVTILAENVRFVVVGFVAMVAALFSFPWHTMLAIDLVYIAIVLQCLWQFRKNRRGLRGL
jgi:CDP-diacylglycerol--serine O-phosphatidyltransferase